jgi:hypothetical protein
VIVACPAQGENRRVGISFQAKHSTATCMPSSDKQVRQCVGSSRPFWTPGASCR